MPVIAAVGPSMFSIVTHRYDRSRAPIKACCGTEKITKQNKLQKMSTYFVYPSPPEMHLLANKIFNVFFFLNNTDW